VTLKVNDIPSGGVILSLSGAREGWHDNLGFLWLYVPAYLDLSSSRMISNLQGTPATTTALEQICYVVNDCWWPVAGINVIRLSGR